MQVDYIFFYVLVLEQFPGQFLSSRRVDVLYGARDRPTCCNGYDTVSIV